MEEAGAGGAGPGAAIRAEYGRRLEARRAAVDAEARREQTIANLRLAVVGAACVTGAAAFGRGAWLLLLLIPAALFLALVILHDRVIRRRRELEGAVRFYESGIARLEDRWAGNGTSGERFADPAHPYAADLDLFGSGSLFELLCTARTRTGEDRLAAWLLAPAAAGTVRARQEAVEDLRSRLDLREELALLGDRVRAGAHVEEVAAWGAAPVTLSGRGVPIAAGVLSACTLAALGAWATGHGLLPFLGMLLVELVFLSRYGARVRPVVRAADQAGRDLEILSRLLARVERETFQAPLLRELRAGLETDGLPPSACIARLERLLSLLHTMRNGLFALLGLILMWDLQLAYALEGWRARYGKRLGPWIAAAADFEALSALGTYACEHPEDPFPEVVEGGPCFDGEGVSHPLLPAGAAVRNDVRLGEPVRLYVVSGSNMSGKSTLLRTVGVNTVLALAGAPVRARRLRLSPVALGASIRVQDSLQAGTSRFYAEITRIRQIVDLASGPLPLLFLLDEILHGTNSHDRRIGAEGVLRALVRKGAIGLVTTHDLALARIADDPESAAVNVHFQDTLDVSRADSRLIFDYRLRPGVVQKSNALELMRAVGLEV